MLNKDYNRRLFFIPLLLLLMFFIVKTPAWAAYNLSNPTISGGVSTWDCVWFGSYFQTLDSNGLTYSRKTPIKWRVLNTDGSKALLLSDKLLFKAEFQNTDLKKVEWDECTLRTLLNDDFLRDIFTSKEQAALIINDEWGSDDQLFLLSLSDATNSNYGFTSDGEYGTNDARDAYGTDYYYSLSNDRHWWLRDTTGYTTVTVAQWGTIRSGYYNNNNSFGVRPAVVLDLNKADWYYAGTVSSKGDVNEIAYGKSTSPEPSETTPSSKTDDDSKSSDSSSSKNSESAYTVGAFSYTIKNSTATIAAPKSKTAKTVTIPATVKINGKSVPVTSVAPGAFKGMKKLTSVTIGKNVKKIGKNAFNGCKKLKKITFKTAKLTKSSVGANAFKGISRKAVVKCPKSKKAAYKKILLKKGMKKTMTFK